MKYAVAIAAKFHGESQLWINTMACLVDAVSEDDAYGKAMRIAEKAYPLSMGWISFTPTVWGEDESVLDPDDEIEPTEITDWMRE